jgi:hypothetical protein
METDHSVGHPRPIHQPVKWLPGQARTASARYGGDVSVRSAVLDNWHSEAQWETGNC